MNYMEGLIDALLEWKECCNSKDTNLKELVSIVLLQLGTIDGLKKDDYDENCLDYLKERIKYLVEKEGIFEQFLVYGALNYIDQFLNNQLHNHGVFLITNEDLYEKAKQTGDVSLEKFASEIKKDIDYYRSHQYIIDKENELDIWNQVRVKHFSKTNIRKWELEKGIFASKAYKDF